MTTEAGGLEFSIRDAGVSEKQVRTHYSKLKKKKEKLQKASKKEYEDPRASINLPFDIGMHENVKELVSVKNQIDPSLLVVIGMGGSCRGTIATQEAITGQLHNAIREPSVLYLNNADPFLLRDAKRIIKSYLEKGEEILVNVVSKSGCTTETLANFESILSLLKEHRRNYSRFVVATTTCGSCLDEKAKKEGFDLLYIPEKVGGRYSVFSPAGLFPLGMLNLDLNSLLEGAAKMRDECIRRELSENPAALNAAVNYEHYSHGKNIYDFFLFGKDLESIGKWHRQLMAESLGKKHDLNGKKALAGLTPLVSVGSTDLHSMAQLDLGGPYDKHTCFVHVGEKTFQKVPKMEGYKKLVECIQGKEMGQVLDAIYEGTKKAYREDGRSFVEIKMPGKNEFCVGALLQYKMIEIMYLSSLMNVNPFNQPNVEAYKKATHEILGN